MPDLTLTAQEVGDLINMMNGLREEKVINESTFLDTHSKAVFYKIQEVAGLPNYGLRIVQ